MRNIYHTATNSRQTRTKPPITTPIIKFSRNSERAVPKKPPGTIQANIRGMPKDRPQRMNSHTSFVQADLKIQYSKAATTTGSTLFLKNSLITSDFVTVSTSIPGSIISAGQPCAQGFSKTVKSAQSPLLQVVAPLPLLFLFLRSFQQGAHILAEGVIFLFLPLYLPKFRL